jgi:hypothetical protein
MSKQEINNKIVVYQTKPHCDTQDSGLGILVRNSESCGEWGFIYHSHIIETADRVNLKYPGCSPREAIQNALKAHREVYSFSCFGEFIEFANDNKAY